MSPPVHIIGIGSPFGDDRLGWVAAEALQHSSVLAAVDAGPIVISFLDRPGAMLIAHWHDADNVIVIDAVQSGAPPGTRHRFDFKDLAASGAPTSSHGFGVASTLELARVLGNLPPRLLLRGIEMDPSNSDLDLSTAVARALPAFIREIEEEAQALAKSYLPVILCTS